jgi:branched-chain amino acid transport system permease protein
VSLADFVEATGNGIALAPIYILTAAGFVIVYRATQVFNFAQGALMLIGAYLLYEGAETLGLSLGFALLFAIVGMAIVGALIYLLTLKPLTGHGTFGLIIVTMGVSIVLTGIAAVKWGFTPLNLNAPNPDLAIRIGDFRLSGFATLSVIATAAVLLLLAALFRYTAIGMQMRAVAESPVLASRRGISVEKIYVLTWMLSGAVAAIAGAMVAFRSGAAPSVAAVGLVAFPAALIGGFDSLLGAVVGGLIVALLQTYATFLWGAEVQDVVVFGLMLAVLLVRPYGLFGTREVQRV